jgi:hypothetical protein
MNGKQAISAILILLFFAGFAGAQQTTKEKKDSLLPGYPLTIRGGTLRGNIFYSLPFSHGQEGDIFSPWAESDGM